MSSSLNSLLAKAKSLPSDLSRRSVAALVGACVADAAARPMHWVYNPDDLKRHLEGHEEIPEFFPESRSPFYDLPTGENSCYFDLALSTLETLAEEKGNYDYEKICHGLIRDFGTGTRYDKAKREEYMQLRREGKVEGPIKGKWIEGSIVKFMDRFEVRFFEFLFSWLLTPGFIWRFSFFLVGRSSALRRLSRQRNRRLLRGPSGSPSYSWTRRSQGQDPGGYWHPVDLAHRGFSRIRRGADDPKNPLGPRG